LPGRGLRRGWMGLLRGPRKAVVRCLVRGYAWGMAVVERISEAELERNLRAVEHAVAQQRLEGLTVSESTVEDMRRAARGEIADEEVIANIYARYPHVAIFRP
jgi:succinate dehydrogenase/fumarate reductase flavoprotein subunit